VLGGCLVVGLGATFLLSAYHTMRINVSGRQISVPDLVDLRVPEARDRLEAMKLRLEVRSERFDPRAGKDRILEQDPLPGDQIKPGRKIRVIVSLGIRTLLVPELRGSSSRKAQLTLQQEGLRVGDMAFIHSRAVEENQVIAQDPPPTTPRQRDGRVNLLVSSGRRDTQYVMPELVGRRLDDVRSFLSLTGMQIGQIREEFVEAAETATVLRQFPPSGYPVNLRQPVTLAVSTNRVNAADDREEDDEF
jgi:serine/threonine-protein kinase